MTRKTLRILVSLLIAIFFLWLAFKDVNFQEILHQIGNVKVGWIFPFIIVMLASHYFRAERWLLLLSDLEKRPPKSTLFAGVMVGYMMNYVFPRLGEVSRPIYVARQLDLSAGKLLGTIVLERFLDLGCLIVFLVIISFYFISDQELISQIFGTEGWTTSVYLLIPSFLLLLFLFTWAGYRLLWYLDERDIIHNPFLKKFIETSTLFWKGLISIRDVKNWPLFILCTLGIWIGYIVMAYLPFWMLDLHQEYGLGLIEGMVITVISAVGIAIPTPGGIGSYHLFVQQSLWLLFSVPLVSGLTYATITHGVTMILVIIFGAVILWFDKYYTLKKKIVR